MSAWSLRQYSVEMLAAPLPLQDVGCRGPNLLKVYVNPEYPTVDKYIRKSGNHFKGTLKR